LISGDEFLQASGLAGPLHERRVEELLRRWTFLGVLAQAKMDEFLERRGEVALQYGWRVLRDQEENLHGVDIGIWRLAVCQLQRGDAERPDICFAVVSRLLDDLGRHPERGAYECILLGHGCGELARDAEIRELYLTARSDQNVRSCYESVS
jgi:hypothetical protein